MKSRQEPLKSSARDFYLNTGTFAQYEAKFREGKNLLDDRIEDELLPGSYDPPYALEKAGRSRVEQLLRGYGFRLLEYRSGCRIPYRFPKTFSRLFRRSGNHFLFSCLAALESWLFQLHMFDGREQNQFFIAARSPEEYPGTLN